MTDKELPLDYVRDGSEGSEIATWLPIDLHVHVLRGDQWWGDHQVCEADLWDEHMVRLLDMALEFWLLRRGIPAPLHETTDMTKKEFRRIFRAQSRYMEGQTDKH